MKTVVDQAIAEIQPYVPGKPLSELERELGLAWPEAGAIKLASNENPLGPSPLAVEAARQALQESQLYPDGSAYYLRQAIAKKHRVAEAWISTGSGSNELIDLFVQTFCSPDEEVLAPAYSFACYKLSALGHRRKFREVAVGPRFEIDVEAVLKAVRPETKLLFIANPNNPTGAYLARTDIEALMTKLPPEIVLVVDEAYVEYVRSKDFLSAFEFQSARKRWAVLRTFSKVYGLAGLRVGYAIAPADLTAYVDRVRMAFNVNSVAQAAALAALGDDAHVARSVESNTHQMFALESGLGALGFDVLPSQGNFLLVESRKRPAQVIYQALLKAGVIVRPVPNYGLPNHLRITVGTTAQNERLLHALATILS